MSARVLGWPAVVLSASWTLATYCRDIASTSFSPPRDFSISLAGISGVVGRGWEGKREIRTYEDFAEEVEKTTTRMNEYTHVPPGGSSILGKLAISRRRLIMFAWLGLSATGPAAAAVDAPPADSPLRLLLLLLAFLRLASKTRQRLLARSAKSTYCFRVSVLSAERFFFSRL